MTRSSLILAFFAGLLATGLPLTYTLRNAAPAKPDDNVTFDLSAENWVVSKTARVTIDAEAAVTSESAGTMRESMAKAVNNLVQADWRLTGLARSRETSGFERWSAHFETRLPESQLSGLNEQAHRLSREDLQLAVIDIDFKPSLGETEATEAQLRANIYKEAQQQLATLNATLPERHYRISAVTFVSPLPVTEMPATTPETPKPPALPQVVRGEAAAAHMAALAVAPAATDQPPPPPPALIEHAEKVLVTARVALSATPAK